jgi:shikimate 5-dehydrogenase/shikimate kinase
MTLPWSAGDRDNGSMTPTQAIKPNSIGEFHISQSPPNPRRYEKDATIVLVGCRGAGKRSLGFIGATHLGRRLITEDQYFDLVTGYSRRDFLSKYGNQEYLKQNVSVLQRMLKENTKNCIIECGMGSLARDAQLTLKEYALSHPVIHVIRNFDRVRKQLGLNEVEGKRLEYADSAHRSCSNFEYYNLHDPSCEATQAETNRDRASPNYTFGLKDAKKDFSAFLDFIMDHGIDSAVAESPFSISAVPLEKRQYTFALQLSLSDLLHSNIDLAELESGGGDLVELKVDTWLPNMLAVISRQMASIRRKIGVPVILSIDDVAALAAYKTKVLVTKPEIPGIDELHYVLLEQGLRLGVEYIAIDLNLRDEMILRLLQQRGRTKTIAHHQERTVPSTGWLDERRMSYYQRAHSFGFELVRLIQAASSWRDNDDVKMFRDGICSQPMPRPRLIAYNSGRNGIPSQMSNKVFSPVTHPVIPLKGDAQDELITVKDAMRSLFLHSVFDPLHFYITGANVSYSLSPQMHGAAYQVTGLQHDYRINQTGSIDDLLRLTRDPSFGGSAVNQPFRVGIIPHLSALSYHARAVGAVNTIVPLRALPDGTAGFLVKQAGERKRAGPTLGLYGDNSDWIGIIVTLRRNLSPRNAVRPDRTTGLVIGAGGMARSAIYGLIRMGCRKIFIYNRTARNARAVADHFNSWAAPLANGNGPIVTVLGSRDEQWPQGLQYPTLVVSCLPAHSVDKNPVPHFEMPEQWLLSPTGGVVLEVRSHPDTKGWFGRQC